MKLVYETTSNHHDKRRKWQTMERTRAMQCATQLVTTAFSCSRATTSYAMITPEVSGSDAVPQEQQGKERGAHSKKAQGNADIEK